MKTRSKTPFLPLFEPEFEKFFPPRGELLYFKILRASSGWGRRIGLVYPDLPPGIQLIMGEDVGDQTSLSWGKTRFPLLSSETIRYNGEPVGVLGSEDEDLLAHWASQIQVILQPAASIGSPKNSKVRSFTRGTVDESLLTKALWVHGEYTSGSQDAWNTLPLEAAAHYHKGGLYLRGILQWPQNLIQNLSRITGLPPEKIFFLPQKGATPWNDRLHHSFHLLCLAGYLSHKLKKPVSMVFSPEEMFEYGPKRPEALFRFKTALDNEGRILSLQAQGTLKMGAFGFYEQEILDRALIGLLSLYQAQHVEVQLQCDLDPTPPRGPIGGWGENLGLFAIEAHAHDIATALGVEPHEWKRQNLQTSSAEVFQDQTSGEKSPLPAMFDEIVKITDYSRRSASYYLQHQRRSRLTGLGLPYKGIGLSLGFQGNGFISSETGPMNLSLRMETSGHVTVFLPFPISSELMENHWKNLVAAHLGLKPSEVHLSQVWSHLPLDSGPATLSRPFEIYSRLLPKTLESLSKKRFQNPLPLEVKSVFRRQRNSSWNDQEFSGVPFIDMTWGICIAEIQVSPEYADVSVQKTTLCIEAGEILHVPAARHALIQSLLLGLGWTQESALQWNEEGKIDHGAYLRYTIPSHKDLGEINILFFPSAKTDSKGLGDLAAGLLASSVLAGVRQALGDALRSIPLDKDILQEAINFHEP